MGAPVLHLLKRANYMNILNSYSEGQKNFGLLLLRVGIGAFFIMHGYPKMIGGPDKWEKIGSAMQHIGVDFLWVVWGFLAAFSEMVGGILMITGILFRPVMLLMFITMVVAALSHIKGVFTFDSVMEASHAIEMAIVFLSLLFIGPGNYRLGKIVIE